MTRRPAAANAHFEILGLPKHLLGASNAQGTDRGRIRVNHAKSSIAVSCTKLAKYSVNEVAVRDSGVE